MAAEGKLYHLPVNDSHFIPTARPSVDVGNTAGGQGAAGETGETGRRPEMPSGHRGRRMWASQLSLTPYYKEKCKSFTSGGHTRMSWMLKVKA